MTLFKGLYDVANPNFEPDDGDQYAQELFQEKQSFVYSVLVTSFQMEKVRELVKEFEGDAQSILSKLHQYHSQSNVAQHEVVALTTYITNLSITDSWKGTTRQFFSHFKEKLRLLDSLVPDTDKIPKTVRMTLLQRAVQQNHNLRQIHVLDSVWRSKTGSSSLLKSIMIYFGMQLTNMTSTRLQSNPREKPSFLKMTHLMIWNMILKKKTLQMINIKMTLHHTQSFNPPPPILLDLKESQKLTSILNSGDNSLNL